jgi:hypothetical protein
MGRVCAWCGMILRACAPGAAASHAICDGCLEELRSALARSGLRMRAGEPAPLEGEAQF